MTEVPPAFRLPSQPPDAAWLVSVAAEPVEVGTSLEDWIERSLEHRVPMLAGGWLIDRSPAEIGGRPAARTLVHHAAGGQSTTVEQWWVLAGGRGWGLSGSCPTATYPAAAATFERVGASLRIETPA